MKYISIFTICITLLACEKINRNNTSADIERIFGVKLHQYISDVVIVKKSFDNTYIYPYTIYISFAIDSSSYDELMVQLGLVNYSNFSERDSALCMSEKYKSYAIKPFWTFSPMYNQTQYRKFIEEHNWWKPDLQKKTTLYGGYYLENIAGRKVVSCKKYKYDGRVISQFSNNKCYMLVECFMK